MQVAFCFAGAIGTKKLRTYHEILTLAVAAMFSFLLCKVLVSFTHDYHEIVIASCVIPFFFYDVESRHGVEVAWFASCSSSRRKENMPFVMLVPPVVLDARLSIGGQV